MTPSSATPRQEKGAPSQDSQRSTEDCRQARSAVTPFREEIPAVVEALVDPESLGAAFTHIGYDPIPSKESVIAFVEALKELVFPGYFNRERLDAVNLHYYTGRCATRLLETLAREITCSIRHECLRHGQGCRHCESEGYSLALAFMKRLPALRRVLSGDIRATYEGDPAAKSFDEIIFSYPGVFAVFVQRAAHELYLLGVPLLPRIMTEYAHCQTGIDLHPGAHIGERFVIDHGTGVVVGETTRIGRNVRVYQGVTLGALSLPPEAGERLRGQKRHPTIEDDVIIYAGATILGGETVIGARSVIGGNVWLTRSVPADTTVMMETPRLVFRQHASNEDPLPE